MMQPELFHRAECERKLLHVVTSTSPDFPSRLSNGAAGVAIMQGHLFQVSGDEGFRADAIESLLSIMAASIESTPLSMSLWAGLPGLLYSFEFLRRVDPHLLGQSSEQIGGFVDDMDAALTSYTDGVEVTSKYDLISGVVGIGLYALMRSDPECGRILYASVEAALVRMSDTDAEGRFWKTAPASVSATSRERHRLEGRIDLGVAHGVAGVVGLMALAMRLGVHTPSTRAILQDTVAWIIRSARSNTVSTFPYFYGDPEHARSRFAWCYGDLGVCAALANAAIALDRPGLLEFARKTIVDRVQQGKETMGLVDAWICHGYAGGYHLLASLNRVAPDAGLDAAIAMLHAGSMAAFADARLDAHNIGLLEGYSGLLLATSALPPVPAPATRPWDLCLATSL
jgi:hypothetical protein